MNVLVNAHILSVTKYELDTDEVEIRVSEF